jgi:DNA-binding response OmpR family regulator
LRSALLIEDAPEFQLLVRSTLRDEFEVTVASDAEQALKAVGNQKFDLILLDVGLPGRDGVSLCEELRRDSRLNNTPILFVTGKNETADLVQGFKAGADDYIMKPFHPDELRARVQARIARTSVSAEVKSDDFWKEKLHFLTGVQRVTVLDTQTSAERDLNLTPNEFKILYLLVKNESRSLSRTEIMGEVWGNRVNVIDRTIDKHICSLRRKMGDESRHIVSVPGKGYAFRMKSADREGRAVGASNG